MQKLHVVRVPQAQAAVAQAGSAPAQSESASVPEPSREWHSHHEWRAALELHFAARADRTILARRVHSGPFMVQRPFYPDGPVCHVYIVHPPGGVVGGDSLELAVHTAPGSHALLTTPAATKFYRNAGRFAMQRQQLQLDRATLEWLPQETILYPQASVQLLTRVRLCKRSRFIGWEIVCYGRPASHLRYEQGRVTQDFELWVDDTPLLIDRLRLDAESQPMRAAYGLANHPVLATMLAYPAHQGLLERVRAVSVAGVSFACSHVDGALVVRAIGEHVDRVRAVMENAWRCLRPLVIGREPVAPRIWST
jgi:urease accessory protein